MAYARTVHPFPARMASEVAFKAFEGLEPGSWVLDPMCGSGVVVRRALDSGHVALGLDIDPLAVLMAKVWTTEIPSSIRPELGSELAQRAKRIVGTQAVLPWIDSDQETSEYLDFWFANPQREELRALIAASGHLRGLRRDIAHLALSRIIVTKSKGASLAADVSHSRPHRVRTENDFDVIGSFEKSFIRLLHILRKSPVSGGGRIRLGDARTLHGVKRESIDAVVTSPPYINAIDYLRGHKLALVWLGYASQEIRQVRSLGIGAPTKQERRASDRANTIVTEATTEQLSSSLERIVKRYVHDLLACLRQTYRVLCPRGYAVYVVSNSVLRGVEVDTARIIEEAAKDAGLHLENRYAREISRQHRYLPPPQATKNDKLAARMRTESVLRFRKD